MSFNKIILLIIAFNVVTSLIARRKRKQAAKPVGDAKAGTATNASPAPERPREVQVNRLPERAADSRASEPRSIEAAPKGTTGGRGKDLFTQLARELGLEIPEAEPETSSPIEPAPSPVKQTSRREEEDAPFEEWTETGSFRKRLISPEAESESPPDEVPGREKEKIAVNVRASQAQAWDAYAITGDLTNREALAKSFALKIILDPPLSLKAYR